MFLKVFQRCSLSVVCRLWLAILPLALTLKRTGSPGNRNNYSLKCH